MFRFTSLFETLPQSVPFVGPEALERHRGRAFKARIGANENVFGPSPKAVRAMQEAVAGSWQYGDPENYDLRQALANFNGISPDNIVVGEGIDALLGYLVRMVVEPESHVVTSLGAYPTFNYHVVGYGGKLVAVPYVNDREDLNLLLEKTHEVGPSLVYLANPDNPMGTWNRGADIGSFVSNLPDGTLLVLDEAYIEFAPAEAKLSWPVEDPRIIRMRTFSKAYGMAGMRVGYALGSKDLVKGFERIRNHFGMCRVSQIGAIASLEDTSNLAAVLRMVESARDRIGNIARANNLQAIPSGTNFVAVDVNHDGQFARILLDELIQRNVFVRMPLVAPQDRCIRISAGTKKDLDLLEEVLPEALVEATERYRHRN